MTFTPPVAEVGFEVGVWGGGGDAVDRWKKVEAHFRQAGSKDPFQVVTMAPKEVDTKGVLFTAKVPSRLLVPGERVEYFFTYEFDGRAGRRDISEDPLAAGDPFTVSVQ